MYGHRFKLPQKLPQGLRQDPLCVEMSSSENGAFRPTLKRKCWHVWPKLMQGPGGDLKSIPRGIARSSSARQRSGNSTGCFQAAHGCLALLSA